MTWKRLIGMSVAAMCGLALTTSAALAGNNLLGNGYPSGPHFNLIILGKKPGFVCPTAAEYRLGLMPQNTTASPGESTSRNPRPRAARSSAAVGRADMRRR